VKNAAAAEGWLPPLAWDDDTIDDPDAVPNRTCDEAGIDFVMVDRLCSGHAQFKSPGGGRPDPAEVIEAVRLLTARGLTDGEIGDRIGRSKEAVLKVRARAGIPSGTKKREAA
jgi:hypothetical protein